MDFYENLVNASASLFWSGPSLPLQVISDWRGYLWSIASGTLPPGLTLNPSTGVVSGTPTGLGTFTFTVRADNQNGCIATRSYSINTNPNTDFGDFNGFAPASAVSSTTIKMGVNAADREAENPGNTAADADDTVGTDDEDGVTHSTLRANQSGTVTVNVSNASASVAYLNVWADWNRNNAVDSGEQIATDITVAAATANLNQVLNVTPPASTATGSVPLRARLSTVISPPFSGASGNGEVEDHLITITAPNTDFSDFNGFAQASSLVSSAMRLGAESDAEAALTGNATADADDTTELDDEEGVTHGTLRASQAGTLNVRVTNTSGAPAYLNVWADWNRNNAVDSGEQLAVNGVIATGSVVVDQVLNVTPPATVATGTLPLLAR
jgi:hypothetical protein